jgi:hypothetical protein
VFVSYSSKDKHIADAAVATLEAKGIRCWIAPRDIVPGKEWSESIISGIEHSRMMVLVFSAHANNSQQVLREVERAVHHGMPIVPFRIENLMPSRAMEYFISTHHWLDAYYPPLEEHLDKLAATAQALLSGTTIKHEEKPKDFKSVLRSAVKSLAARDNRPRVLVGAALLLLLVGLLIVGSIYALQDPKASAEVIQAKADAEILAEEVKKIERGPGIDARLEELEHSLKTGQGHYEHKKFKAALVAFQRVRELGPEIKELDMKRQEAKTARDDMDKAKRGAEAVLAEEATPGPWQQAKQRSEAAQKAWDAGDYAESLNCYRAAATRYRSARQTAGTSGQALLKALAYITGYAAKMRQQADSAADIAKNDKSDPKTAQGRAMKGELAALDSFGTTATEHIRVLRNSCASRFKLANDPIAAFCDERDYDKRVELYEAISHALTEAHGTEIYGCFWFGHDMAYVYWVCHFPYHSRTPKNPKNVLGIRLNLAYSAGCPDEVIAALVRAKDFVATGMPDGKPDRSTPALLRGCYDTFLQPLREQHFKDLLQARATFAKSRALPPLPAEQQEAIHELHKAGAYITYVGDPVRPWAFNLDLGDKWLTPLEETITARVLPFALRLPTLVHVQLHDPDVTDDDLPALSAWKDLAFLSLRRTRVTDAGLAHLAKLTNLKALDLRGLPITDQGLEHLKPLKNLKGLSLQQTRVTPAGIEMIKKALPNLDIGR